MLKQTRETDIPIRFGGEEFVVFLPAPVATATLLAERVRKAVEALNVELDGVPINLTISGGITAYRRGETLEDFMHRADQHLYKAKEGGRNRNVSET